MSLTQQQLSRAIKCSTMTASQWIEPLNLAMGEFGIVTPAQQAAFLAQIAVESAGLTATTENLNYSMLALERTFARHFKQKELIIFARKPERIANRVYANRLGNGNEASGDGWKYRGRGLIQITGKANYQACGESLGVNFVNSPELLSLSKEYAARSAAWYWNMRNCNALIGDFAALTKSINGGLNGYNERLAMLQRAKEALA